MLFRSKLLTNEKWPLPVEPLAESQNSRMLESITEDSEAGLIENSHLFADKEWLPPADLQLLSLLDLQLTPPLALQAMQSQAPIVARPFRFCRTYARLASAESSTQS